MSDSNLSASEQARLANEDQVKFHALKSETALFNFGDIFSGLAGFINGLFMAFRGDHMNRIAEHEMRVKETRMAEAEAETQSPHITVDSLGTDQALAQDTDTNRENKLDRASAGLKKQVGTTFGSANSSEAPTPYTEITLEEATPGADMCNPDNHFKP